MRSQETLKEMWETWNALKDAAEITYVQMREIESAFTNELTERKATVIAGICEFKQGSPTYHQPLLTPLWECDVIPKEELDAAYTAEVRAKDLPPEQIIKEGRLHMTKVKTLARKYGAVVQGIIDRATQEGQNKLVVVRKEDG